MSKKRLDHLIQNISLAMIAAILMGNGLTKAVAYGAELAAASAGTELSGVTEAVNNDEEKIMDFSVRLLQQTIKDGKNTMLSPYSVLSALSMTANGAGGNTLSQMETVFGMTADELKVYLSDYQKSLSQEEEQTLSAANSIWLKEEDSLEINQEFLQTAEDWYDAEISSVPMNETTLHEINGWVNEKTDGMIPEILDEIPEDAIMYLINALAFDGEWEQIYSEEDIRTGTFTREDGSTQEIELMHSEEYQYLEDDGAIGFLKNYKNGKYAFAALLPEEGTAVEEYVKNLTGERLFHILSNVRTEDVDAAIPKFKAEYSAELSEALSEMGMPDAFSENDADFSKLCTSDRGNAYIGRVLHRTLMEVHEKGTKAGAVTAVEIMLESAMEQEPAKAVHLDRPFVCMLIDRESQLPIFLGTVMSIE